MAFYSALMCLYINKFNFELILHLHCYTLSHFITFFIVRVLGNIGGILSIWFKSGK